MFHKPRAEIVAEEILDSILSGSMDDEDALPPETELAKQFGVSRLTLRDSMKFLQQRNVIHIQHGRRSSVIPSSNWLWADPFIFVHVAKRDEEKGKKLLEAFLETRLVVEVGIAKLAAERATAEHKDHLKELIMEMKFFQEKEQIEQFAQVDLDFHTTLLEASNNVFVSSLFDPIADVLKLTRLQTCAHEPIRKHAILAHERIYEKVFENDPEGAAFEMQQHIVEVENDIRAHIKTPLAFLASEEATSLYSQRKDSFE